MDDAGLYLSERGDGLLQAIGHGLLVLAPWLMKTLSVVGTLAMFLVGGGILMHGVPQLEHLAHSASGWAIHSWGTTLPWLADISSALLPLAFNLLVGVLAGTVLVGVMSVWEKLRGH